MTCPITRPLALMTPQQTTCIVATFGPDVCATDLPSGLSSGGRS